MMQRGFSLMEIMVALVIFSMISVGAFGVLTALQRSQVTLDEHSAQLETLQRMILLSHHDISQSTAHLQPADSNLTFTMLNWPNPLQDSRSTLATVRYAMEGDALTRRIWPVAASPQDAPALRQVLADHLQAIGFRSVAAPKPTLPAAMEMTVTLPPFGEVRQLIPLVSTP